jgi:hypothetical protein
VKKFLRKELVTWKNRVHEMLVTKEPNKTIGVDKIFRIHKPEGYKPKSAERNFRHIGRLAFYCPALSYTIKPKNTFYRTNVEKCIDSSMRALAFPELEDTLRYDVLM